MRSGHAFSRMGAKFVGKRLRARLSRLLTATRKQWLRGGSISVLVLGIAGALNYQLAHFPVPVDVPEQVAAEGDRESLVLESPLIGTNDELLQHRGRRGEAVDVYFDHAAFAPATLQLFRSLGVTPPEMPGAMAYITKSSGNDRNDTCRTSLSARIANKTAPASRLTIFQQQVDDVERHRYLGMNASHLDLAVELNTIGPTSDHDPVGSCSVMLRAGDWTQFLGSSVPVTIMVAADSNFRFHFESLIANESPWGGTEDMFEPFSLSAGIHPLTAEGLHVGSRSASQEQNRGGSRLTIRAASPKSAIRVDHLKVGTKGLQIAPSGKGWVTENGEKLTIDFKKRVTDNPILAALLTALNGWLLRWCWRQFPKRDKNAAEKIEPAGGAHAMGST